MRRARAGRRVPSQRRPEKASLRRETSGRRVREEFYRSAFAAGGTAHCIACIYFVFAFPASRSREVRSFSFFSPLFSFVASRPVLLVLHEYGREPGASLTTGLAPAQTRKWQRIKCTATTAVPPLPAKLERAFERIGEFNAT